MKGRPYPEPTRARVRALYREGRSYAAIAAETGVSLSAAYDLAAPCRRRGRRRSGHPAVAIDPKRLRHARSVRCLWQRDLGKMAGVDPKNISRYENGTARPEPRTLAKLAKALGVEPAALMAQGDGR